MTGKAARHRIPVAGEIVAMTGLTAMQIGNGLCRMHQNKARRMSMVAARRIGIRNRTTADIKNQHHLKEFHRPLNRFSFLHNSLSMARFTGLS